MAAGISLAQVIVMAMPHAARRADRAKADWLHWLFVQGDRAISCSLDVCRDGTCMLTIVPLWSPDDQQVEMFLRPADAAEWHERMTRRMNAAGWRLVEGGIVTHAA